MVELRQVSFRYENNNGQNGLREFNLKIADGEFVLLCGSSGCGKTTVTRLINGLVPHFYPGTLNGQVLVNGKEPARMPLFDTASMVGSVFQNPRSQFFNVDTTSELAFGCENMGMPQTVIQKRMRSAVHDLKMEKLLDRSIFALSGGEKQKIACGSAAALEPQVLVLDEPSANLDAAAIEELKKLLMVWKAQGKTIIIAEHRLYYLAELADRVLYMENGTVAHTFSGAAFAAMPQTELRKLGLRVLSLKNLPPRGSRKPITTKKLLLKKFHFAYRGGSDVLQIDEEEVPCGAIVAIVGSNGAGKSTFARCLCGLERRCPGTLSFGTKRFGSRERLNRCYMVMQDVNHQLFTESVLDEVLLSMEHEDEQRAHSILDGLGLLPLAEAHPLSLSGGQKQRVAIASAVASERSVILFDEPTSGLDLRGMERVARNVRTLAEMGKTIFVVTHDPEFILACCTHLFRLKNGNIVENRPLDDEGIKSVLRCF